MVTLKRILTVWILFSEKQRFPMKYVPYIFIEKSVTGFPS